MPHEDKTEQFQAYDPAYEYWPHDQVVPMHARQPVVVPPRVTAGTIFVGVFWALVCWTLMIVLMVIIFLKIYLVPLSPADNPIKSPNKKDSSCAACLSPSVSV